MLYNPNWNQISLADLIAWLETKPAGEEYCYQSNGGCLIAQYLTNKGYTGVSVGGTNCHYNWPRHAVQLELPQSFYDISVYQPRTFGAALRRAKAAAMVV